MPSIDVILITVAVAAVLIGVALSYWDDIGIWWFELTNKRMSEQEAMDMFYWLEDKAVFERDVLKMPYETYKATFRAAIAHELYATRLMERRERKGKHKD